MILTLALSSIPVLADVAADDAGDSDNKIKTLVVLGDFISSSLSVEPSAQDVGDIAPASYADLVAEELSLKHGEGYFNYAVSGSDSQSVLDGLCGAYGDEKLANIARADVVMITVGGNELVALLLPKLVKILGLDDGARISDVISALSGTEEDKLDEVSKNLVAFSKDNETDIRAVTEKYGKNLKDILDKLKTLAPSAQIFLQTVYDPLIDMPEYKLVKALEGGVMKKLVADMNNIIVEAAKEKGAHVVDVAYEFSGRRNDCTNIEALSILPNPYGHSLIADSLLYEIEEVFGDLADDGSDFAEPKDLWIYFAAAIAIVALATPIVVFFARRSSGV